MATQSLQKVYSSAIILLVIDSKVIGTAQACTVVERWTALPVTYGLGSIKILEHVITDWQAEVTLEKFAIRKKLLSQLPGTTNPNDGVVPRGPNALNFIPITITVQDKVTGEILDSFKDCTMTSHELDIREKSIVGERGSWVCVDRIDTSNGSGTTDLPAYTDLQG
jgi:hypothetical protein